MKLDMIELGNCVRKKLSKKRFWHSLGVAYMAADMALLFGVEQEKALAAGLLHDCAKCLSDEEILKECIRYNIEFSEIEKEQAYLLHAKLGAYYARLEYKVEDAEILSAITWHTTGKPAMTTLEKIIFLADFAEPMRKQPTDPPLNEIRRLCLTDLDKAVYVVARNTFQYLKEQGTRMDPATEKTYLYYMKHRN